MYEKITYYSRISTPHHVPVPATAAPPAYSGPGDIVSIQATSWWGLRGYNSAYAGAAIDIVDSGGGNTTTINIAANNFLDEAAISTFVGAHGTASVTKIYDQVGTNHMTQGTVSAMPTIVQNGLGSHSVMNFVAANSQFLSIAGVFNNNAKKWCLSAVGLAATGNTGCLLGDISNFDNLAIGNPSGTVSGFSGSALNSGGGAPDNAFNSGHILFAGAASVVWANQTSNSGDLGNTNLTAIGFAIGQVHGDTFHLGKFVEGGIWVNGAADIDISGDFSAIATQQKAQWGF